MNGLRQGILKTGQGELGAEELGFIDGTCKWFIRGRLGIEFWLSIVCFN